jgi:hypothetical protein
MKSLPRLRRTSSSSAPWIFIAVLLFTTEREPEDDSFNTFDEWTCTCGEKSDGKQSPGQLTPSESESRVRTFVPRDFDGVFPLGAGLFKKDLANHGGFQAGFPL